MSDQEDRDIEAPSDASAPDAAPEPREKTESKDTKSEEKTESKDTKSEEKTESKDTKSEEKTESKDTKSEEETGSKSEEKAESQEKPTEEAATPSFEQILSLVDLESKPTSKAGWLVRAAVTLVGIVLLSRNVSALVGPMLRVKPPPPIPTEELPGDKFRLSEAERKEIFREFATAELAERARAVTQNTWGGHAWSREDDRGYIERTTARAAAARHHCSLSQVYLVLDEGIREKWPGPDGKPLPATTPPFNPRSTW